MVLASVCLLNSGVALKIRFTNTQIFMGVKQQGLWGPVGLGWDPGFPMLGLPWWR